MTEPVRIDVLRFPNGTYGDDTAEWRRRFPDAIPVRIQKPTFEEANQGIGIIELASEDDERAHDAKAKFKKAPKKRHPPKR